MKHKKLEILHYKAGSSDKVYIVELLQVDDAYYVYANYGKRAMKNLIKQLKLTTSSYAAALAEFNSIVASKTREGYDQVRQGAALDIPGFPAILAAAKDSERRMKQAGKKNVEDSPAGAEETVRRLPV